MWVGGNYYLNAEEMNTNVFYIYDYLHTRGWTKNAICGMLGNMQTESTINPSIWQSFNVGNLEGGYGLVQWTPCTKYFNWCDDNNLSYSDMDSNLERIIWEVENDIQWYNPSMSFYEFTQSTDTPYNLGLMFLEFYERPRDPDQPIRGQDAEDWFTILGGGTVDPDPPDPTPTTPKKKSNIFMIMGRRRI